MTANLDATVENDGNGPWDVLVVGGGIMGAAIFHEAVRLGLRTLLVEQRDFAWGTSSRSSKLVHGGLRYLREGNFGLTIASVHQRDELLEEAPGLVEPLGFLWATYEGDRPGRWTLEAGLSLYDLLSRRWSHRFHEPDDFLALAPHLETDDLKGGFGYGDAQTDDSRLVLRLISEAVADGGVAHNYTRADRLLRDSDGTVRGARLVDEHGRHLEDVAATVVVNATGAWADQLREEVGGRPKLRPLRGSHLVFSSWCLPVAQAISFAHPDDKRPVFILPWEGVTLVGTTDVDYEGSLNDEPRISGQEVSYLMRAVAAYFPSLSIGLDGIVATFAGVRPIIRGAPGEPSEESRDHALWWERGLLTVTGGKLTTFRLIARDAVEEIRRILPHLPRTGTDSAFLNPTPSDIMDDQRLDAAMRRRLLGRYGLNAPEVLAAAKSDELERIPGTAYLWAELRWSARHEWVCHLDDLLLRRLRLGLLLPDGAMNIRSSIESACASELPWDEARWQEEWARYARTWRDAYHLPDRTAIPAWKPLPDAQPSKGAPPHIAPWKWISAATILSALAMLRRRRSSEK